ncbi:MAG: VPLPA-CTERM sorting domain-containing protein [Gammaproteobacteria bacterium]|nr:VPLPA-CTERM sorting domain-containing protein [Gammaproteobacteria bacterium]
MNYKKTAISVAMGAVLGLAATTSQADVINMSYTGAFTMLGATGLVVTNDATGPYWDPTWNYGMRTTISGTMTFDTATGSGTGTVDPFDFFAGSGAAVVSGVSMQVIDGGLILGNMNFAWGGSSIATNIVLDGSGLFAAMGMAPIGPGMVIDQAFCVSTGYCATAASDAAITARNGMPAIGAAPIVTSTYNVAGSTGYGTTLGQLSLGVDDGIGGSPMDNGPFEGFNANFDITSLTVVTPPDPVPVPAAVWLFGSGLIGLVGFARRKKA